MEELKNQEKIQEQKRDWREDEIEIDLKEIFFLLVYRWKMILLALLAGAAVFGAYHTFMIHPSYQADASIYITSTDSVISFSDMQLSSALTEDYANIITSRTVLNRVIDQLQLDLSYDGLRSLITVSNPEDSHIINMQVVTGDPELSRNIVNALMNISIEQIYQIVGSSEPTVIDYSIAEAVEDVTPGLMRYLAMGGLLGAFAVCALLVIRMLMDSTIKTEDDVEKYLGLPTLAAVPYFQEGKGK